VDAKKPRPNLHDVARHAGVSPATVSRVLNNTAPVRDDVRQRVVASANSLGYRASSPRGLSQLSPKTIAMVIPDILNPYFPEIVRGIQDEASANGFMPLVFDFAEDSQRELEVLKMLASQSLCGIVLCGSRVPFDEIQPVLEHQSAPLVVINRTFRLPKVACIMVDLENATFRATRHLLELNHKRIAYLSGPSTSETSRARRAGVEQALAEAGLALVPELCPKSFPNVDGGFQTMTALLQLPPSERPTAVIAYNDLMAFGVVHSIRIHHLRVPEDISVVGIDNIAMSEHANPPLTTVSPPKYRMGRMAMQTLRRMIQGHLPPEEGYMLVECPLIVRESTAPAPTSNGMNYENA
jgi:LacI family transcriptional regulator